MNNGFIKLNRSRKVEELIANFPNVFLLLTIVAMRARREYDPITGLNAREALIGDHESCGLTRQQYRTALKIANDKKFLEILETCRNRKKSTNGSTTTGTKVKLLESEIWDINTIEDNHRINHRPTTDQPPTNHEQEYKKDKNIYVKEKIIKKENPKTEHDQPIQFSTSPVTPSIPMQHNLYYPVPNCQLLKIKSEEHESLLKKHSPEFLQECYEFLKNWLLDKPEKERNKYSHAGQIKRWVVTAVKKQKLEEEELVLKTRELKAREERLKKIIPYENNQERAKAILSKFSESKDYAFEMHKEGKGVLFYNLSGAVHREHLINFTDPNFEENLLSTLEKYQFKNQA